MPVPYAAYVTLNPQTPLDTSCFPGNLRFVRELHLEFRSSVTFFVGENGSGKSTLLEAIAVLAGFPLAGGGINELGAMAAPEDDSELSKKLRLAFHRQPRDGYFFRAELQAQFASLLEAREADVDFVGDPFARYGGQSLHALSHGEAFLSVMQNRFREGLFLLDEPESALSPQRQLSLLALIFDLTRKKRTQFLIATHSPILLTFPGADIVSFDGVQLETIAMEQTSHYQITRGILNSPEAYWQHLRKIESSE